MMSNYNILNCINDICSKSVFHYPVSDNKEKNNDNDDRIIALKR